MSRPGSDPPDDRMERFWDAAAREHAAYYVESRLDYRDPDMESFWAVGEEILDGYAEALGVSVRTGDRVVEVGCGIGRITRALAGRGARVTALDVSAEMLDRARAANPGLDGVTWLHGDGSSLAGIADGSADAVFSHVVFQHVPNPETTYAYVREMGRVLAPGGWAAFQVSNDPSVHRPRKPGLMARLRRRAPRGTGDPAWVGSAVDLDALTSAVHEGGLEVGAVVGTGTQFCLVRLDAGR